MTSQADQVLLLEERPVAPAPRRRLAGLIPTPRGTPFTFGYLVVLLGTTLILRLGDPVLTSRLLQLSSTDAHNLWHRPLFALFTSALWLSGEDWVVYVLIFAITVAPLERRLGAGRTAGVFCSGHVLATLLTEIPIMIAISGGALPKTDGQWLDIGVSYGFFATAGTLAFLLAGRRRLSAVLALEISIALIYALDDPTSLESVVTLAGHLTAAHFGLLCCGPFIRRLLARVPRSSDELAG